MKSQKSFETEKASLYLVPTPIGNLNEMTPRALDVLSHADVVACEDTRNTGLLLSRFDIKKPLISHHEHNQKQSIDKIISLLEEGKTVAVTSDAGYPLLSDPGQALTKAAIEKDFPVISLSGSNAALNALVASGLDAHRFLFYGFLDSKSSRRKKELESLKELPYTLIFYEAPHRIVSMLEDLVEVLGNRQIALARELTKIHEEFLRGNASEVLGSLENPKGEMVVVVSGYEKEEKEADLDEAAREVLNLVDDGMKMKEAVKNVSMKLEIKKNLLYSHVVKYGKLQ